MTYSSTWKSALLLSLALGVAACASTSEPANPSVARRAPADPGAEVQATAQAAAVFQLVDSKPMELCSAPTLHGLDKGGAKLWSKTFVEGEVHCNVAETRGLVEVRVDHPYLALRRPLRYSSAPSRPIKVDCEFFGNCSVSLASLTDDDVGAYLVLRRPGQESYGDAFMAGRYEVLNSLNDLLFHRLPIGRYEVALLRNGPFNPEEDLYHQSFITILPCQELAVQLADS